MKSALQPERIVIVGAGQSAAQAVATLRGEGFAGYITLIGDEPWLPYQRPPLSKAYLKGEIGVERLELKALSYFQTHHCELLLGAAVLGIDRHERVVTLAGGNTVSYDKLLLATGANVRCLRIPGAQLSGVYYLRGVGDADAIRAGFKSARRIAIVGAGYIGLEVAAVAAQAGLEVTVFETAQRVMSRVVSEEISTFYAQVHQAARVRLVLASSVERFEGEGRLEAVCAGGVACPADLALVGVGSIPNDQLAAAAGIAIDDGVLVDEYGRTSDPHVFASGDCTRHPGYNGERLRLECVQNAVGQGKHTALAMLGRLTPYQEIPWFWSDQYHYKLQIAGLFKPEDQRVLRGDARTGSFSVFHLRQGVVCAVEAVNSPPEYMAGRKMIAAGTPVAPEQLVNTAVPIRNLL